MTTDATALAVAAALGTASGVAAIVDRGLALGWSPGDLLIAATQVAPHARPASLLAGIVARAEVPDYTHRELEAAIAAAATMCVASDGPIEPDGSSLACERTA